MNTSLNFEHQHTTSTSPPSLLLLSYDGRQSHNDGGQSALNVLVSIVGQSLDARHDLCEDGINTIVLPEALTELCRVVEVM